MKKSHSIFYWMLLLFYLLPVLQLEAGAEKKTPEVIVINNPNTPRAEKEALLILPGLGDSKKGRKKQKAFFAQQGFDLFIPDYAVKQSYAATVENLATFYQTQNLGEYKKLHVFSYILGSWVINDFITKYGAQNISSIVYDRSPLQERAPRLAAEVIPRIAKMAMGELLLEFAEIPYSAIEQGDINIGIIVESKATKLIRMFRKKTLSYGPIDWQNLNFKQAHDDLIYTRLNHDEMYVTFDEIGPDIIEFLRTGKFLSEARRTPFTWDVFEKHKK